MSCGRYFLTTDHPAHPAHPAHGSLARNPCRWCATTHRTSRRSSWRSSRRRDSPSPTPPKGSESIGMPIIFNNFFWTVTFSIFLFVRLDNILYTRNGFFGEFTAARRSLDQDPPVQSKGAFSPIPHPTTEWIGIERNPCYFVTALHGFIFFPPFN